MTPLRYTMEGLARISDEEMVRRQFNLRNLGFRLVTGMTPHVWRSRKK